MLLHLLSTEEQKRFIDLLNKVALADGEKSVGESHIFEKLRGEVNVGEGYKLSPRSTDSLIAYFSEKDAPTKKIVFMNLSAMILNDEIYSIESHEIMEKIKESFALTDKEKKEIMKIVYQERDLREMAKRVVNE